MMRPTTAKRPTKGINMSHRLQESAKESKFTSRVQSKQSAQIYQAIDEAIASQKHYEQQGEYVEAEALKRRVRELKNQVESYEQEKLLSDQKAELLELEEAHLQEVNIFNIEWDKALEDYRERVNQMSAELAARHQEQLNSFEAEQQNGRFKDTPEILELKKIEQELAKQENYIEARKAQLRAKKLQKQALQKWQKEENIRGRQNNAMLRRRQENELIALSQRMQMQAEEKRREQKRQRDQLMQKYANAVRDLEYQHGQQLAKFNKSIQLALLGKKSFASSRHGA